MITKEYKTLEELVGTATQPFYKLHFNDFKNRTFHHPDCGYVKFSLPDEEIHKAYVLFASCLWTRNIEDHAGMIDRYSCSHGIFSRLWLTWRKDGIKVDYCAGQDYPSEIRCMQNLIRNNK